MDPFTIMSMIGMGTNALSGNKEKGSGSNPLSSILGVVPGILSGLFGYSEQKKQAKQKQQAINQMLQNTPKFDYSHNDLFGYNTSPMQNMLNFGMMNSLIDTLAPTAGLDLGENFAGLWDQYSPETYAFGSGHAPGAMGASGIPQNPMSQVAGMFGGGNAAPQNTRLPGTGMNPGFNPNNVGQGSQFRDALASMMQGR